MMKKVELSILIVCGIVICVWIWYSKYVYLTIHNNTNDLLTETYVYYKANRAEIPMGNIPAQSKQSYTIKFTSGETPILLYYKDRQGKLNEVMVAGYAQQLDNKRYRVIIQPSNGK